jgi:hypothetical protein
MDHFFGVALFTLGSSLYSLSLLRLAGIFEKQLACLRWGLEIFLVLSTAGLMLAFVILWAMEEGSGQHVKHMGEYEENSQTAYIVEHAAYMSHLVFYVTFFSFHTPNPLEPPGLTAVYDEEYSTDPRAVTMRPLLRPAGPSGGM